MEGVSMSGTLSPSGYERPPRASTSRGKYGVEHLRQAVREVAGYHMAHTGNSLLHQRDTGLLDQHVDLDNIVQHPVVLPDERPYPDATLLGSAEIGFAARLPRPEEQQSDGFHGRSHRSYPNRLSAARRKACEHERSRRRS